MRRREFIALMGASVALPFAALAQEPGRVYRLGGVSSSPTNAPQFAAMFDALRRLGFITGQNLTVDWRSYGPRIELIPEFTAELVKSRLDVILVNGDAAIRAAQQATTTIPILGITDDMVGQGLVDSLARPGGNTTGTSIFATELDGKRQEILIEAVPELHRLAPKPWRVSSKQLRSTTIFATPTILMKSTTSGYSKLMGTSSSSKSIITISRESCTRRIPRTLRSPSA
jgi:putative ABC transport system substrate-binding protein